MDNKGTGTIIFQTKASKRIGTAAVLILISVILACSFFALLYYRSGAIASVGKTKINKADIRHWITAESCYGNAIGENTALVNLIEAALERETLSMAYSNKFSRDELIKRSEWIDANTKAPKILACAKSAFENDENGYLRWYVAPTLENPALHEQFSLDAAIKNKARNAISAVMNDIDSGKKLSEEPGYRIIEWPIQLASRETLDNLDKGFVSGIIEDNMNYSIYELLSKDERNYRVGIVYSPKADFETWFADFTKEHTTIEIADKKLRQALLRDFKDSKQWVSLIK